MSLNWDAPNSQPPFPDPRRPSSAPPGPDESALRRPRVQDGRTPWTTRLGAGLPGWFWRAAILLVVADFLFSAAAARGVPYSITRFFDGDEKTNFPTAYKTLTLLAVTLLLLALHSHARWVGDRFAPGWLLLAAVSAFAFVDESTYLHQTLSHLLQQGLHTSGVLRYAWIMLYVPALLAVGVVLLRYLHHLPPDIRNRVFVGGVVYGFGAVAMEPLKARLGEGNRELTLPFKLTAATSDSLEMIGLTILVVALLRELARRTDTVALELTPLRPPAAATAGPSVDLADPGMSEVPADPPWSRRQGTNL